MIVRRRVIFTEALYERLRAHLMSRAPSEEAAVLLAGWHVDEGTIDLLVREVHPVPVEGFAKRGSVFLEVDSTFYAPLLKRCREEGWGFILSHSHPFGSDAYFSGTDDAGEQELMPRLFARAPERPHGALVMGLERGSARIWIPSDNAGVRAEIHVRGARTGRRESAAGDERTSERFDRQARALGRAGQARLESARIGLVGLGGLGSQIYQQLKYLGVREIVLVDRDRLEETNLNRVVTAVPGEVGRTKVDVAADRGRTILPGSSDVPCGADVTTRAGVLPLLDCDLIFVATDNLLSRTVINRIMSQYLIPVIDAGIDIDVVDGQIRAIGGRVTRVIPGAPCQTCSGILDPARVAAETQRTYLQDEPAPSVVSLNGVVASLAVTEALDHFTGFAGRDLDLPRSLVYDGRRGTVRSVAERGQACGVCDVVLGAGDVEKLPVTTTP